MNVSVRFEIWVRIMDEERIYAYSSICAYPSLLVSLIIGAYPSHLRIPSSSHIDHAHYKECDWQ